MLKNYNSKVKYYMENILRIIYEKTINNKLLNIKDIEKILELLVVDKCLNDYILGIEVQSVRSNHLASYSNCTKNITLYISSVDKLLCNIDKNIFNLSDFEKMLYKNLSILQILLHEIEHANQERLAYNVHDLESFIVRLSYFLSSVHDENLYECCPLERLAEIKSFQEINLLMLYFEAKKLDNLKVLFNIEKLQRLMRGYHYNNSLIAFPLLTYFSGVNRKDLLQSFDWYSNDSVVKTLESVQNQYILSERLKYGFPISAHEYGEEMKYLILSLNKNFKNRIQVN